MPFPECFNFQLWVINLAISRGTSKNIHTFINRAANREQKRWTIFLFSHLNNQSEMVAFITALPIHGNLVTDMKKKNALQMAHTLSIHFGWIDVWKSSKIEMSVGYWVVYVSILHNSICFDIDLVSFFDIHSRASRVHSRFHIHCWIESSPLCLHSISWSMFYVCGLCLDDDANKLSLAMAERIHNPAKGMNICH